MFTFTIIIPVKPGGTIKALDALRQLNAHTSTFEIIIAEGTKPSRQRNLAAEQAKGNILFFVDDDSCVLPDFLTQCATAFEDPSVAVVGGPSLTPESDSRLQQLFGYMLTSSFGSGAMRNRYRAAGEFRITTEQELILCNMAIRRDVFLDTGGFDERLYPNEENELLDRIASLNFKLIHVPTMAVKRSQRSSIKDFTRQMFSYGRGRAQQTLLDRPRSVMSFMPLIFVIYLASFPLFPGNTIMKVPLITYLALDLIFTVLTMLKTGKFETLFLVVLFPLMHCANGVGLICGFLKGKPTARSSGTIAIKKLKEFDQSCW